ncbi:MAG: tRNA (guanosine(46)-N7)-methyltransferase TrmB [Parachlamydiaceae bacterium]|nr:tRNA (guanosine(46)-N7)-methyltransferase TrmB [Parachlamydiaceae bacterium]
MRPSDLKIPVEGNECQAFIYDRLLRVPKVLEKKFEFPGWQHPDLFGNGNKVQIEYCSGNGGWIASKAAEDPTKNWVAIEMRVGRSRKIWSKIKNLQLSNLFIVHGEGYKATKELFPSASVQNIYINFPDPWPKRRHSKYRIIQPAFVAEMSRILLPGGTVTFVTDDEQYSEWTIEIFSKSEIFSSDYPEPYYCLEWQDYGTSYFEDLWRQQGKIVRYHHFRKL